MCSTTRRSNSQDNVMKQNHLVEIYMTKVYMQYEITVMVHIYYNTYHITYLSILPSGQFSYPSTTWQAYYIVLITIFAKMVHLHATVKSRETRLPA